MDHAHGGSEAGFRDFLWTIIADGDSAFRSSPSVTASPMCLVAFGWDGGYGTSSAFRSQGRPDRRFADPADDGFAAAAAGAVLDFWTLAYQAIDD